MISYNIPTISIFDLAALRNGETKQMFGSPVIKIDFD
jgi:hypothetical protein